MSIVGYARVSTQDQDLAAQVDALEAAGAEKIYQGKQSGKSSRNLKKLDELLDYVREGDVVVVTKLDRLGRSLNQVLNTIQSLQEEGVSLKTLDGQVDTSRDDAMSRATVQLIGVFAELEHSMIVDRLQSGRQYTGKLGGRPKKLSDLQALEIKKRFELGESKSKLATDYGVSRVTIKRKIESFPHS